jgi:vanillate O-demethylase monooxygenase subunit
MSMKMLDRGIRFERWLEDQPGNFYIEELQGGPCDEWLGYDYLIPGVLIMWVGAFPVGTARAVDHGRPDFSQAIARVSTNVQAITPASPRHSRYYFTAGLHRAVGGGAKPELVKQNYDVTVQAFNEDKRVIEAQQQIVDREPDRPFMPTTHDRGVTLYTRLKSRLIAEERGELVGEISHIAAE